MLKHVLIAVAALLLVAPVMAQDEVGTLTFTANGEDFIRQGFVSKDGWDISFSNVTVNVSQVRAYQTSPSYNPDEGELVRSDEMVGLPGSFVIDLAEGDEDAAPLTVATLEDVPAGFYNALAWTVAPPMDGDMAGTALQIAGTATRDGETVDFTLNFGDSFRFNCGAFVGDDRLGIVEAGADGMIEMTFHFDHIFGDAELAADDSLNVLAPGFDPFAGLAEDGVVMATDTDYEMGMSAEDFDILVNILPTLGHTGEGHCLETLTGTTG